MEIVTKTSSKNTKLSLERGEEKWGKFETGPFLVRNVTAATRDAKCLALLLS